MFNKKAQGGWGIFVGVFLFICLILAFSSCESVPAGSVGVKDTFGSVEDTELQPGIYWLNPFTNVVDMTTQVQKVTYDSVIGISLDSQEVTTEVTVNYRLDPPKASDMYKNVGSRGYVETIGQPIIIAVIKSELAKYQATEFAKNWEKMKAQVSQEIVARLLESGIVVTEVSITDFDFTAQFNKAIEDKVTAEQGALQALNDKQKAITQAEAKSTSAKLEADGIAYSTKVTKDAEAYGLRVVREELEKSPRLVEYTVAQKWDGALSKVSTSGTGTFVTLPDSALN